MSDEPVIDRRAYIVDDDGLVRSMVRRILTSCGIYSEEYSSAAHFLEGLPNRAIGCILLDVRMPGMSGIDLLQHLKGSHARHPVIMMSGHAELPEAVSAVRSGALDFIEKPFRKERLLEAVEEAFGVIRIQGEKSDGGALKSLTPREKEVLAELAEGAPNKAVARRLELSVRTVEMHRANIVKKLGLKNITQALFLAKDAGLS